MLFLYNLVCKLKAEVKIPRVLIKAVLTPVTAAADEDRGAYALTV